MKQIVSMARLTGQLEKMFRVLNADFFNGELEMPVITVSPTLKAYAHYTPWNAWESKETPKREINVSSLYLNRELILTVSSLLHEMCHMYNDTVLNIQDTSRQGYYHNAAFKKTAEAHGLICTKSTSNYGWCDTSSVLSDELIDWVLLHDEFREIELSRSTADQTTGMTTKAGQSATATGKKTQKSSYRRYVCPNCGAIVRATKEVNIACLDCIERMELTD